MATGMHGHRGWGLMESSVCCDRLTDLSFICVFGARYMRGGVCYMCLDLFNICLCVFHMRVDLFPKQLSPVGVLTV